MGVRRIEDGLVEEGARPLRISRIQKFRKELENQI